MLHDRLRPPVPRLRIVTIVNLVLTIALATVWFVAFRPAAFGGPAEYAIVDGVSLEPALRGDDFVLVRRAADYRLGEIIAYRVPAGAPAAGLRVVHRIVGRMEDGRFVTQGDNRTTPDPWRPRPTDVAGRVVFHVPAVGSAIRFLRTPPMFAWMVGSLALIGCWRADARRRRFGPAAPTVAGCGQRP